MGLLLNLLSGFVVIIAVIFTVYVNYPEPPLSPLLYQWQSSGQSFKFKGYNIFYKDDITETAANDIIVLCLHGFPTSSYDWYKTWPDLKRNVKRVIAPDFLGFGFSDKPRFHSYSIKEQSDLIEELLYRLKVKSVHLLAHDYAVSVAQELMARQMLVTHNLMIFELSNTCFQFAKSDGKLTFDIQSVCLLNGGIFPSLHRPRIMQKLLRTSIVGTVMSKLSNYYMFKFALSEVFGPNTQPEIEEFHDFWKIIRQKNGYRVLGDILSYIDERFQNEDRWVRALRTVSIPLHCIYGPSDPVNPWPFEKTYREIIPNASLDVLDKDIGHYPQLESPKRVIQLYLNWLKQKSFVKQLVFNT